MALFLCVASLVLSGCVTRRAKLVEESVPRYPQMPAQESLARIQDRNTDLQDVTGKGTLTFTGRDGRSVRLEAVFVLAPPARAARVRAWKFGRAVFDLTRTPEGVWLYLPRGDEGDRAEALTTSAQSLGDAIGQWLDLFADGPATPGGTVTARGETLVVRRPMEDGLTLRATIDRRTLTARQYDGLDTDGRVRFRLVLDQYRELAPGGAVWPQVIEARSASGTVRVEASELEVNIAPPTAFVPPTRARRLDGAGADTRRQ